MKLKAKLEEGKGWGVLTTLIQKPAFPFLKTCANGTINGKLKKPIRFKNFDYVSQPLLWDTPQNLPRKNDDRCPPEIFKFIKCTIKINRQAVNGFIYISQYSYHRQDERDIEIIAPYIDLGKAKEFIVIVDNSKIER